ncbi:hypothetical protein HYX11_01545 [Candidatus Woesearchaeota archaeon]|nr:hypothetical protein [Candidatus Woesearchaeota archaeon]
MTQDKKIISMKELIGFSPEDAQRVCAFYLNDEPKVYVGRTPLPEEVRTQLGRVVYLGPSVPEEEAIESARRYFSEHCSGVKKE